MRKEFVEHLSDIKSITLRTNDTEKLWYRRNDYEVCVTLIWCNGYAYSAEFFKEGIEDSVYYLEHSSISAIRQRIRTYFEKMTKGED